MSSVTAQKLAKLEEELVNLNMPKYSVVLLNNEQTEVFSAVWGTFVNWSKPFSITGFIDKEPFNRVYIKNIPTLKPSAVKKYAKLMGWYSV